MKMKMALSVGKRPAGIVKGQVGTEAFNPPTSEHKV